MTLLLSFYLTNNADRMPSFVKEMLLYNVYFFCSGWSWGTRRRALGWTGPRSPTSGGTFSARPKLSTLGEMLSHSRWRLKVTIYLFFQIIWKWFQIPQTCFWKRESRLHDSKRNRESPNSDFQPKGIRQASTRIEKPFQDLQHARFNNMMNIDTQLCCSNKQLAITFRARSPILEVL